MILTLLFRRWQLPIFTTMFLNLWQQIDRWDKAVFIKLNSEWTNPLFDSVLPYLRNSIYWLPLYLFLLVFAVVNFKSKGFWWFVFFVCTIALCDMIGTYAIKHQVERFRPCRDPEFMMHVRLLINKCAGGHSFISNHAANHFGMATFFYISFRRVIPRWAWIGFVWAGLIIYAQVYVGVHYPSDVLGGALVGILIGNIMGYLFNKRFGIPIFENQPIVKY